MYHLFIYSLTIIIIIIIITISLNIETPSLACYSQFAYFSNKNMLKKFENETKITISFRFSPVFANPQRMHHKFPTERTWEIVEVSTGEVLD